VPGPSNKRSIAGKRIEEMMFWVPGLGSIGVVLSLFSYGDRLSMGACWPPCPQMPMPVSPPCTDMR
jgi:hypothetical protein